MRHALIIAHPNPKSFTHSVARAYSTAIAAQGHEVVERDLYAMGFDPCLKREEVPTGEGYQTSPDAAAERARLAAVDVFAFFYPWWFNAPPAILKGYVDRIFCTGFGYRPGFGGTEPMLTGRKLISFSSSGAPDSWVRQTGALSSLIAVFDCHLAAVCGLQLVDHVHLGGVVPDITQESVEDMLAEVRAAAARAFPPVGVPASV
ncbi:NAD(P)H-dependent oxidoreductase [Phenylobacterium sp.]|uniref:NAD(P)H-dependent oxidoreductase n=1 Tax=Phenylobacterium sp. TaxID=1871053 RepID=UPI002733DDF5|nr:NAD(P)H-dependent oxidoreductase [Phenylobacterium sp.]MDP3852429.1 NAD(P)H-dependent oxidoreductase [Phenylobacterium sp.]